MLAGLILEKMMAEGHRPEVSTTKRLVVPGDLPMVERLRETGLIDVYQRAGFRVGPPGCSMCLGIASEKAGHDEVWLTSQNRNYQNRMGAGSLAWLASGATVAASAMSMKVTDPSPWIEQVDQDRFNNILNRETHPTNVSIEITEPSHIGDRRSDLRERAKIERRRRGLRVEYSALGRILILTPLFRRVLPSH